MYKIHKSEFCFNDSRRKMMGGEGERKREGESGIVLVNLDIKLKKFLNGQNLILIQCHYWTYLGTG
jgi:hypothetical protein